MMSYWVITVLGHVISCVTIQQLTKSERNIDEWSQRIRDYNIVTEKIIDVKDEYLSKYIGMV